MWARVQGQGEGGVSFSIAEWKHEYATVCAGGNSNVCTAVACFGEFYFSDGYGFQLGWEVGNVLTATDENHNSGRMTSSETGASMALYVRPQMNQERLTLGVNTQVALNLIRRVV